MKSFIVLLQPSIRFDGFLTSRITWSKNVKDNTNSPTQILLPDMDPTTCVYLNLALWLEEWLEFGNGDLSPWLFIEGRTNQTSPTSEMDREADLGKARYSRALKSAIDNRAFHQAADEKLGSHSIRKAAATKCRENGCPKDDLDYRARWSSKRMQDAYVDSQLSWPDVNCASRLCFKGVCKYKIKDDAGVCEEWLCQFVAPRISTTFGNKVGSILGTCLLWACFNETVAERVHPTMRNRICGAFISLERQGYIDGVNPVEKVELIPNEGQFRGSDKQWLENLRTFGYL